MANNQLLASDNFASGSLAAGWASAFGASKCQVVLHQAEANILSTEALQLWQSGLFGVDQSSEFTIGTGWTNEAGSILVLYVRGSGATSGTKTAYEVTLANGFAFLYVVTNGTAVQQGPAIAATIAAGDVWILQAAGSIISLYQNNNFVGYFADASIKSGSPGFGCYSSVDVAHAPVASWRGYNCVQQDGIWSKQGVVIAPNASDLTSFGAQNPTILLDSNPQILSGSQVLKMWFWADSNHLGYAESPANDGINWTRGSDVLVGNIVDPVVLKIGATYHLYGINLSASPTQVFHFTSSDGITWSVGTQVLAGTAAAWDAYLIFFTPFYIDSGGTWHAVYTGSSDSTGAQSFNTGYATSPDGLTWTKYAGNPVAMNFYGLETLVEVNGVWYGWGTSTNPGRGGSDPGVDPACGLRMQTTDFIHWTNPIPSVQNSQLFQGVNRTTGGVYPTGNVRNINGRAYMYSDVSTDDTTGSHNQISLAIAPASIDSIVKFREDGISQVATDSFTSGAGDLNANWTLPSGGTKLKIVAGPYVEPTVTSTVCSAVYTGASFQPSQYSEITIQTLTGTLNQSIAAPTVRGSTSAQTWYEAQIGSPTATSDAAAKIFKRIAGTPTQIGPTATIEPQVGDVFRLSVITGSDGFPVLSLYQNGFLILQVQDYSAAIASGNPGIWASSSVAIGDAQISKWAGGNANQIPIYSSGKPPLNATDETNIFSVSPASWVGTPRVLGAVIE